MRPSHQLSLRLNRPTRRKGFLPDLSLIAAPLLRNGNRRGNPNAAPRCGARTRAKTQCLCPAMANGRCRMHGGASTGPRTAQGRARIAKARTRHGRYSKAARTQRAATRQRLAETATLLQGASALTRAIRRGRTPDITALMHLAVTPFLPPGLLTALGEAAPLWQEDPVHREIGTTPVLRRRRRGHARAAGR